MKFTDIQAVIGIEQMKKMNYRVKRLREIYDLYYQELNEIVKNTKYLFNSTSINPLNTFGFNKFPERYQLQRKSRVLEYAINGCIIFSEILPQKCYKTFSKETIPIIEVPRNVNQGEYCLNYLSRNNIDLDSLSRTSYIKV